jgi:hypothetical protein
MININTNKLNNKSQISIFLLFAVIIVISMIYIIFSSSDFEKKETEKIINELQVKNKNQKTLKVKSYFQTCLDDVSKKGVYLLGLQGGYIYFDDISKYTRTNTISTDLSELGIEDKFLTEINFSKKVLYNSFYIWDTIPIKGVSTLPNLSDPTKNYIFYNKSSTDDLTRYIVKNFDICLKNKNKNFNTSENYNQNLTNESIKIDFTDNEVNVEVKFSLLISNENSKENIFFEVLKSQVSVPYKSFRNLIHKSLKIIGKNRSKTFKESFNEVLSTSNINSFFNLSIKTAKFLDTPEKKIFIYAIYSKNIKLFGRPFIYQFLYLNQAPTIKSITLTRPDSFDKDTKEIILNVKKNIKKTYTIKLIDRQIPDNFYNLKLYKEGSINDVKLINNKLSITMASKGIENINLVVSDGETKNIYSLEINTTN